MANININGPVVSDLDDLRNVDLTTIAPSTNDVLVYDGANFKPQAPVPGGVTTVNTQSGDVVLDTDDITEGITNKYYTEAKVSANSNVAANTAKISFDSTSSTKLSGIEALATADQTGAEIKVAYELEANTNSFTDDEKSKLAGLESSKFLGTYIDLTSLQTAHPSPVEGSYAHVDGGVGSEAQLYIWDFDSTTYYVQAGSGTEETAASIKTKYESNADTNAFTDTYKTQVDTNTAKVGYTEVLVSANSSVVANTAKVSADANATNQGNVFNGNTQLVQTDATGKLPAIDGSSLTNLPAGTVALNDVTDVTITTPVTDQVLTYNGANWVNQSAAAGGGEAVHVYVNNGWIYGQAVTPSGSEPAGYEQMGPDWKLYLHEYSSTVTYVYIANSSGSTKIFDTFYSALHNNNEAFAGTKGVGLSFGNDSWQQIGNLYDYTGSEMIISLYPTVAGVDMFEMTIRSNDSGNGRAILKKFPASNITLV